MEWRHKSNRRKKWCSNFDIDNNKDGLWSFSHSWPFWCLTYPLILCKRFVTVLNSMSLLNSLIYLRTSTSVWAGYTEGGDSPRHVMSSILVTAPQQLDAFRLIATRCITAGSWPWSSEYRGAWAVWTRPRLCPLPCSRSIEPGARFVGPDSPPRAARRNPSRPPWAAATRNKQFHFRSKPINFIPNFLIYE